MAEDNVERTSRLAYGSSALFPPPKDRFRSSPDAFKSLKCFHPIVSHMFHLPSDRETDAFRMKAISLMKKQAGLFSSIQETLSAIRRSPIYPVEEDPQNSSILTLEQTLIPFPGERVVLRGSFRRDPDSPAPSIPLTGSFQFTRESIQTGFPEPFQHNGWALSRALIPVPLLRPLAIKPLVDLIKRRDAAILAFNQTPSLLKQSCDYYVLKTEAIRRRKSEFFTLQQRLWETLVPKEHIQAEIPDFFRWIASESEGTQLWEHIQKQIISLFMDTPCKALKTAWTNAVEPLLFAQDPAARIDAAQAIFKNEIEKALHFLEAAAYARTVRDFMKSAGTFLGKACLNIYLQGFSEHLACPPPKLSLSEKMLQSAALVQQERFIQELTQNALPDDVFERIETSIRSDIALFEQPDSLHPLCKAIEHYYSS